MITNMKESFPVYIENIENFLREETDGRFSLILYSRPEFSLMTLNKSAKKIIDLCDGKTSIYDIAEYFKTNYKDADPLKVDSDVERIIHLLWRLGAIEINGNNLFLDSYQKIDGDVTFRYLGENEVKSFWNTKLKKGIVSPYVNVSADYTPVEAGARWFNGSESFISVSLMEQQIIRMAIRLNPFLKVYDVAMITYDSIPLLEKYFPAMIRFVHENYLNVLHYDMFNGKKPVVHINCSSNKVLGSVFKLKGVLEHEINDKPVFLYEYTI